MFKVALIECDKINRRVGVQTSRARQAHAGIAARKEHHSPCQVRPGVVGVYGHTIVGPEHPPVPEPPREGVPAVVGCAGERSPREAAPRLHHR